MSVYVSLCPTVLLCITYIRVESDCKLEGVSCRYLVNYLNDNRRQGSQLKGVETVSIDYRTNIYTKRIRHLTKVRRQRITTWQSYTMATVDCL